MPIFTVALPFTITLTHPIPSDATNGIMMTGSYIFSSFGSLGGAALFEKHWGLGIAILIGFVLVTLIASFVMKNPNSDCDIDESFEQFQKNDNLKMTTE